MTKTLNQIIFFLLHQNLNIFFSNIGNQNIFLEKTHYPPSPFKLNGRSLNNIYSIYKISLEKYYSTLYMRKEFVIITSCLLVWIIFTLIYFFFYSLFFNPQVTKEMVSPAIGLVSVVITMEDAIHKLHALKIKVIAKLWCLYKPNF